MSRKHAETFTNGFILDHYLKHLNEETIITKQQHTCGELCSAACKKLNGTVKKDYEPYQTLGPLCGIFDQRDVEQLKHHADHLGFDAISVDEAIVWFMDCLNDGLITSAELGVDQTSNFEMITFDVEGESMNYAGLGISLLNQMILPHSKIPLQFGARKFSRRLAREKGRKVLDQFVYIAFARQAWVVANQYWIPDAYSPMTITGKYYMHYGRDFLPSRELCRKNARDMLKELMLDNLRICSFHSAWAEALIPDIVEKIFEKTDAVLTSLILTADRITICNALVFWELQHNMVMVFTFLKKKINGVSHPEWTIGLNFSFRTTCQRLRVLVLNTQGHP